MAGGCSLLHADFRVVWGEFILEGSAEGSGWGAVMRRYGRHLISLLVVWSGALCSGQAVTVCIINAKNGHPLKKQTVTISPLYKKGEKTPAEYDTDVRLETDASGEVRFTLPEPAPARVSVWAGLPSEHWRCRCDAAVFVATQDVVQNGIVEGQEFLTKSATPLKASPGRIIFLARPITLFERIMAPLARE